MSVLIRPDRDMSTPANYTTLAFPHERGESVRATPTSAAAPESGRRKDQAPSFSRCSRHPRLAASGTTTARNVCFRAIAARSRRWSPACHPDPSPQSQERKSKKKKEGRRNADRRVVHDPRFGAARPLLYPPRAGQDKRGGARLSAFHHDACCSERTPQLNSSHALPVTVLGRSRRYPLPAVSQCSDVSRTGHSAGRACLPEPPGSGSDEPPPAGAAPLRQPASPADVP